MYIDMYIHMYVYLNYILIGLTTAGPYSQGVRHGFGWPAREDLHDRVGTLPLQVA